MSEAMRSTNFSRIASRYDETRDLPAEVLVEAYRRLENASVLSPEMHVLDAGCGTAQTSLPLIRRGYRVTGIDISSPMLGIARAKAGAEARALFILADVQDLPFDHSAFDATVVSKLFMHVGNWRRAIDEIFRVTASGGHLIHIQDHAAFQNSVRRRMGDMADEAGYRDRFVGAQKTREVREYLQSMGVQSCVLDMEGLEWQKRMSFDQALRELREHLFAEFWGIPDEAYGRLISQVEAWARAQSPDLSAVEILSYGLRVDIYKVS